jgi:cobalt-zinc-cadmium efflux system protein
VTQLLHDHPHTPAKNQLVPERNLLISALLNLLVTGAEVAGGMLSNSLALLSDALHNLGDTSSIFVAYLAHRIGKKDRTFKKTFGYKRIEILAALFNGMLLVAIVFFLFNEAWKRIFQPEPVKGLVMLLVAGAGLVTNLLSVILLKKHSEKSINIRAAYVHLIGDTLSSLIVIIAAVFIYFFHIFWIDPLVTFLLGIYLLVQTYRVIREAVDILMQATPPGLDLNLIKKSLEKIPAIDNIHHVHAWNLSDQDIHFECHIDLKTDIRISETEAIQQIVQEILVNKFHVNHVTIQYEYNCCDDKNIIHAR